MTARARAADALGVDRRSRVVGFASGDCVDEPLRHHQQSPEHHRRQRRDPRLEPQLIEPFVQPRLQGVGALSGFARVEPGAGPASLLLRLELLGPVIPVGDLLGEAVLHGGLGLRDQHQPGIAHLGQMLRDDCGNGIALRLLLHVPVDPGALRPIEDPLRPGVVLAQRTVVEVGRIVHVSCRALGIDLHVQHAPGDRPALSRSCRAGILDGVFQVEQHAR